MAKIRSGKTKKMQRTGRPGVLRKIEKDDITGGNGVRHEILRGKGIIANAYSARVSELLTLAGIPNVFLRIDERNPAASYVLEVEMIPVEVVIRRVAEGSILKRRPDLRLGEVFEEPLVEFYIKDDEAGDPIMVLDSEREGFCLHSADKPISPETQTGFVRFDEVFVNCSISPLEQLREMQELALAAFMVYRDGLRRVYTTYGGKPKLRGDLRDVKFEFGVRISDAGEHQLLLADAITPDEGRAYIGPHAISKELFRQGAPISVVEAAYRWALELVRQPAFLELGGLGG